MLLILSPITLNIPVARELDRKRERERGRERRERERAPNRDPGVKEITMKRSEHDIGTESRDLGERKREVDR